jgi:hypothetical protein
MTDIPAEMEKDTGTERAVAILTLAAAGIAIVMNGIITRNGAETGTEREKDQETETETEMH